MRGHTAVDGAARLTVPLGSMAGRPPALSAAAQLTMVRDLFRRARHSNLPEAPQE